MTPAEEYFKRIFKVLLYIETHLDKKMTLDELASIACYSPFHFHRVFQIVVGERLHEYIKRLRLEKAAARLLFSDTPITEIALDAQYDTPSSFSRAFKQLKGHAPKDFRKMNVFIETINQKIKEISMIEPKKIEKDLKPFEVIFIRELGDYQVAPRKAWMRMLDYAKAQQLDLSKARRFGVAHDNPEVTEEEKLRFDACLQVGSRSSFRSEIEQQKLGEGSYAVFEHVGPYETLDETFSRAFLKWFPQSKKKYDDTRVIFCEYLNMELVLTEPEKLKTDIYIPIQ